MMMRRTMRVMVVVAVLMLLVVTPVASAQEATPEVVPVGDGEQVVIIDGLDWQQILFWGAALAAFFLLGAAVSAGGLAVIISQMPKWVTAPLWSGVDEVLTSAERRASKTESKADDETVAEIRELLATLRQQVDDLRNRPTIVEADQALFTSETDAEPKG
jgi:hypothetical protein